AGAAVSQPVGELWNGGAVAGYLKVAGASWLTVGSDGTVSGTAPADVPSEPATITVQATDGTTTSQLTLEVPVVASGTAPPLATVTWNLWDDGTHADNATRKALGAIAANGFDVIGVQEDGGVGALALAHALGWYGAEGAGGVGIVSAYPIDAASVTGAQGAPAVGVTVDVLGQSMRVWSVGLDATGYGPAAACTPGASADAVLAAERASLRYAQAQTIARAVAVDTASAA
ncbi:endonuclease/exonuclease/phosphatase family protein, partial [Mesorhizobium japonicum]|uniref:endonuclease/exonuclease/phosphatase family protein n=1 Tax=Mesorhizobium japonicum TaxID=2066070 RepID=UPI003B58EFB5